jgi:DNA-binding CsgD family transcriptional regulator
VEYNEKKWWRIVAIAGTAVSLLCCIISIFQYFQYKQHETFLPLRYDSLTINSVAFICFVYLIFNPLHFRGYCVLFYIYGLGNLLDNGNILGFLCIVLCYVFLYMTDFFKKKRTFKIVLLAILPLVMLLTQFFRMGLVFFLISVMHIVGSSFITALIMLIFYPRLRELDAHRTVKYINPADCTPQELNWLQEVLGGMKYSVIAEHAGVSESKIKTRMLELYQVLGVHDKTEFLTLYHNCELNFSVTVPKATI